MDHKSISDNYGQNYKNQKKKRKKYKVNKTMTLSYLFFILSIEKIKFITK